jgi:hypothetical protein
MLILKQSTSIDIRVGPFVDATDGVTPETGITLGAADQAEVLKANGAATTAMAGTFAAVTGADGWYDYTVATGDVDTVGEVVFVVQDSSVCLPVLVRGYVIEEAVYDALYAASSAGPLQSTVAGRTLDVSSTGEAGIDWANVGSPTTTVDLSATSINLCDTITTYTSNTPQTGDTYGLANGANGFVATKADTAAILIDTAEIGTAGAGLTALASASNLATVDTNVDAILVDTGTTAAELAKVPKSDSTVSWNATALADIADEVWDESLAAHQTVLSAGRAVTLGGVPIAETTLTGTPTTTSMQLTAGSTVDGAYEDHTLVILSGATVGETSPIATYTGATRTCTFAAADAFTSAPSSGDSCVVKLDHVHPVSEIREEIDANSTQLAKLDGMRGATFNTATDSLEAIRDRGDAAWTTGAGGSPPQLLVSTTIATLATQVSFTLTAGSADNDAYNGAIAVITDVSTSTQKAVATISDYVGSTKTVTLSADPAIFTMAATDTIEIIAALGSAGSAPTAAAIRAEIDANSTQLAAIVADTNELQSDNIPGLIATAQADLDIITGVSGVNLLTATQASIDAIETDTAAMQPLVAKIPLSDGVITWNSTALASINAECDTALTDYDGPTNAEMVARTILAANYFDPAVDVVARVTLTDTVTTYTGNTPQTGDSYARIGAPAGASVSADVAAVKVDTAATLVDTGTTLPALINGLSIVKNAIFSNFEFLMVLTSDGRTPATGLTVTGQKSIDGSTFSSVSGTIAEVSNGIYQFDALAADTNGDVITWRFSAATADDTFVSFKTIS